MNLALAAAQIDPVIDAEMAVLAEEALSSAIADLVVKFVTQENKTLVLAALPSYTQEQ
jgi:hypothetical protein